MSADAFAARAEHHRRELHVHCWFNQDVFASFGLPTTLDR